MESAGGSLQAATATTGGKQKDHVSSASCYGRSFVVLFMSSAGDHLELQLLSKSEDDAEVVISSLTRNPHFFTSVSISGKTMHTVRIPIDYKETGNTKTRKTLEVYSTQDIALYALNKRGGSKAAFQVLPVHALGATYRAVFGKGPTAKAQIGIVAIEDTTVKVSVPSRKDVKVEFSKREFRKSRRFSIHLKRHEGTVLLSNYPGTLISAGSKVAVFCGLDESGIAFADDSTGSSPDNPIVQLPPLSVWGEQFILTPHPSGQISDEFQVMSHEEDTTIRLYIKEIPEQSILLARPGSIRKLKYASKKIRYLKSDKPVLVTQFVKSIEQAKRNDVPSCMIVPHIHQYATQKTFFTPTEVESIVWVIVEKDRTAGLSHNGKNPDIEQWGYYSTVDGFDFSISRCRVDPGVHYANHREPGVRVGVFVYGIKDGQCAHAYAAGVDFKPPMYPELPSPIEKYFQRSSSASPEFQALLSDVRDHVMSSLKVEEIVADMVTEGALSYEEEEQIRKTSTTRSQENHALFKVLDKRGSQALLAFANSYQRKYSGTPIPRTLMGKVEAKKQHIAYSTKNML